MFVIQYVVTSGQAARSGIFDRKFSFEVPKDYFFDEGVIMVKYYGQGKNFNRVQAARQAAKMRNSRRAQDAAFRSQGARASRQGQNKAFAQIRNQSQYGTSPATLNPLFNVEGATQNTELISASVVTGAGKKLRMVQELDINALFEANNTEENSNPVVKSFIMDFVCTDDAPFIVYPFLATLEAGQSVPSTDEVSSDITAIVNTALTGHEHSIVTLGELVAQRDETVDQTGDWNVKGRINLTNAMNQYFGHCARAEFRGETAKELMFGWIVRTAIPEASVSILGWKRYSITQKKRSSDFKF
jgi:hypothetical protein